MWTAIKAWFYNETVVPVETVNVVDGRKSVFDRYTYSWKYKTETKGVSTPVQRSRSVSYTTYGAMGIPITSYRTEYYTVYENQMKPVTELKYEAEPQYKNVPVKNVEIAHGGKIYTLLVQCDNSTEARQKTRGIKSSIVVKELCGFTYWKQDGEWVFVSISPQSWGEVLTTVAKVSTSILAVSAVTAGLCYGFNRLFK